MLTCVSAVVKLEQLCAFLDMVTSVGFCVHVFCEAFSWVGCLLVFETHILAIPFWSQRPRHLLCHRTFHFEVHSAVVLSDVSALSSLGVSCHNSPVACSPSQRTFQIFNHSLTILQPGGRQVLVGGQGHPPVRGTLVGPALGGSPSTCPSLSALCQYSLGDLPSS